MGIFSKQKDSEDKITVEDEKRMKMRSTNLHDPILSAVNNAQPYEEANVHIRSSSLGEGVLNDVFGNPIVDPDISNPTRSRNERPLDTIRGFEYSIAPHPALASQLESNQLGWGVRDDYPLSNGQQLNYVPEQAVYSSPPAAAEQTKKKRGLFGWGKSK
ncbi:hypothetical protein DAMA08_013170 [Martiniozyma asiatica (nom. inval.)]|nr:hypothetical protein DAMA08_013170 [Martiniozyma asiatica]